MCVARGLACITSAPASMSTLTVAVFGTPAPSITASISGVSPYLSGVLTSAPAPISACRGGGGGGEAVGAEACVMKVR